MSPAAFINSVEGMLQQINGVQSGRWLCLRNRYRCDGDLEVTVDGVAVSEYYSVSPLARDARFLRIGNHDRIGFTPHRRHVSTRKFLHRDHCCMERHPYNTCACCVGCVGLPPGIASPLSTPLKTGPTARPRCIPSQLASTAGLSLSPFGVL